MRPNGPQAKPSERSRGGTHEQCDTGTFFFNLPPVIVHFPLVPYIALSPLSTQWCKACKTQGLQPRAEND